LATPARCFSRPSEDLSTGQGLRCSHGSAPWAAAPGAAERGGRATAACQGRRRDETPRLPGQAASPRQGGGDNFKLSLKFVGAFFF